MVCQLILHICTVRLPNVLCVCMQEGVRYVVAGYMHEELFCKTLIVAGFTGGEKEADLVELIVKWFCSTDSEASLPLAMSSDGNAGGVGQFIRAVGTELGRPIL